eukprot:4780578-Lingulodinium_polyedra.AAC.1
MAKQEIQQLSTVGAEDSMDDAAACEKEEQPKAACEKQEPLVPVGACEKAPPPPPPKAGPRRQIGGPPPTK